MALDANGKLLEEQTSNGRPYVFGDKDLNAQRIVFVDPADGSKPAALKTAPQGSSSLTANVQNVTTAGTRVQLPNIPCREIMIIAKKGNTGSIYVGGGTVSSTVYGAVLDAEANLALPVSNANMIWIDASVNGEGVSYFAI